MLDIWLAYPFSIIGNYFLWTFTISFRIRDLSLIYYPGKHNSSHQHFCATLKSVIEGEVVLSFPCGHLTTLSFAIMLLRTTLYSNV